MALRSQVPAVAQSRKLQVVPVTVMSRSPNRGAIGWMKAGFLEGSLLLFQGGKQRNL